MTLTLTLVLAALLLLWCLTQKPHTLLRIYGPPALLRYFLESQRDKLVQYQESPGDGRPYSLIKRSWVYRAAKGIPTKVGFGTTKDLHASGTHTIRPAPFGLTHGELDDDAFCHKIGRGRREFHLRYPAVRSGMSFGALGAVATRALSDANALLNVGYGDQVGALDNTGEGFLSPHHCPVTFEGQEYLDRLSERASQAGIDYTFRFDRTAAPGGGWTPVPLQLGHYEIREGRVHAVRGEVKESARGVSEMPRKVIVQCGPGMVGFCKPDGEIDWEWINYVAGLSWVAGFEVKAQQGAKANDYGFVKAEKMTKELQALRFAEGGDYKSPERLTFIPAGNLKNQVRVLMEFFDKLQALPNVKDRGLITGYKMTYSGVAFLEWLADYLREDRGPDYLIVDGAEGGTGAGDPIMTDRMGVHTYQGLNRTHQLLLDLGVRRYISLVTSGRLSDSGDIATVMCLGADYVGIARGNLLAMGCIQARSCHNGKCPTGLTTQSKWRQRGVDPALKAARVAQYNQTLRSTLMKIARAACIGLDGSERFTLDHLDVVTGVGRLTSGRDVYQIGKPT